MKREIYKTLLDNNFSNFNSITMQTFVQLRRQLIADILDSHLSFDAVRATTEWEDLNCLEQMTLEDLIDM